MGLKPSLGRSHTTAFIELRFERLCFDSARLVP